jgi:hypothetical protein
MNRRLCRDDRLLRPLARGVRTPQHLLHAQPGNHLNLRFGLQREFIEQERMVPPALGQRYVHARLELPDRNALEILFSPEEIHGAAIVDGLAQSG